MPFIATGMDPEIIILNEVSQTDGHCHITAPSDPLPVPSPGRDQGEAITVILYLPSVPLFYS